MADGHHPNLNLTPEEKRLFYQLFQAADKTNLGVITGEVAVTFFEKTNLSAETLGLIWQIADNQNRGLLTPSGFGIVMRLIGHAQAGRVPTEELALQPGPLPKFSGLSQELNTIMSPGSTASPPPGAGPVRVPPLNPDDIAKFSGLFEKSDTQGGYISGEIAKQIFERARLPNEVLGRIWNLADSKQRGVLDATEFIIAMHLLSSYKTGTMRGLPQTLPAGLYEAAARRGGMPPSGNVQPPAGSRASPDVPPVPAIPKQFSGHGGQRTQSPLSRSQTGSDWLITPQEKAQFDSVFGTVDKAQSGFINGDQAVGFFTNARLPEETLAQVWDLADIDSDGQLSKDEFAVAMYLIRQQRTTKEPLPQSLPAALIPPSMRRQAPPRPMQAQTTGPRSAAEDLFGLDVFTAPAAAQVPQSTGGSNSQFQPPSSPSTRATPPTTFKPFVPSSSFGQALNPQTTGGHPPPPNTLPPQPPQSADDLLGDADPEESKKLTQDTTDLANLSNQVGTLSKEMQVVQDKRGSAEQNLNQVNQQKRDFETRLAQARAMYEQELKDFKALEERLEASRAETRKVHQDFSLLEASRQDLQNKYNQAATALETDQRENATLKEKIKQANAQVSQLKPQLEKARSEGRQQKGLVAINKKQLATVEGERDRTQEEIDNLSKDGQEVERQMSSQSQSANSGSNPASNPASAIASPAASTASQARNPFFRRTTATSTEGALSPQSTGQQQQEQTTADAQNVFDNVFGPSISMPSTSSPPATTFRTGSPQVSTPVAEQQQQSGTPTPSASPPPPPPLSRQLTPSGLPIEGHQASETSSVKPSPPASRFGTSAVSEPDTQSSTGDKSKKEQSPFGVEESQSSGVPDTTQAIKSAPEEKPEPASEAQSTGNSSPKIPGSFPASQEEAPKKDVSFDELFGGLSHERSQSQRAKDFEEAFATMKVKQPSGNEDAPKTNGAQAGGLAHGEFPPIRELDDDDDDSTDSEGPAGFDDDFTPASPPRKEKSSSRRASKDNQQGYPFPSIDSKSNSAQQLPGPDAQQSPPAYEANAVNDPSESAPAEFKGLLPGRTDPTSPGDAPHSVESTTKAPVVGGVPQHSTGGTDLPTDSSSGNKKPDFEAAFAGLDLAPAKEAEDDGEDDDDFESPFNKDASNFDMAFDSHASPPKPNTDANTANASSENNNVNADFFTFDANNTTNTNNNGTNPFPSTSPDNQSSSAQQKSPSPPAGSPASNHDWDALFSVLDSTKSPEGGNANNSQAPPPTSEEPDKSKVTAMSFPQPPTQGKPPGWALNTDPGEDDMILQRLTGMGYARDESLAALEKFDYNLDKAADFLASKS